MVALTLVMWIGSFGALEPNIGQDAARTKPIDWARLWSELRACEALESSAAARRERLRKLGTSKGARDTGPRGALLRASVARLSGLPARLEFDARPWPFDREESWLAAETLENGPRRATAVQVAVGSLDDALREGALEPARARLAFDVWVDAAERLDLDGALGIGRNLHERARATWSAISLGLSLMRAGLSEEADRVLAAQLRVSGAAAQDAAALWDHRGIIAIGAGNERSGRTALGQAVLNGSVDGAVVLARLDLAAGRLNEACLGFRGAMLENPASDWARRGWALALLPSPASTSNSQAQGW